MNENDPSGIDQVPSEALTDRVAPAMKIIAEIMKRAQAKAEALAEQEEATQQIGQLSDMETVDDAKGETIFVSIDGDSIGNKVALAEEKNDENELMEVSRRINEGQAVLTEWANRFSGKVIEAGGDEGLVKVPRAALKFVEELRARYLEVVGATATVGVGDTIRESTKARELGKLRGKDRTVIWQKGFENELASRVEDEGEQTESKKLKAAGLGGADEDEQPEAEEEVEPGQQSPEQEEPAEEEPESGDVPKYASPSEDDGSDEYEKWKKDQKGPPPGFWEKKKQELKAARQHARDTGTDAKFLMGVKNGLS